MEQSQVPIIEFKIKLEIRSGVRGLDFKAAKPAHSYGRLPVKQARPPILKTALQKPDIQIFFRHPGPYIQHVSRTVRFIRK